MWVGWFGLVGSVWVDRFVWLVGLVWLVRFGWLVWFGGLVGWFGLVGLVWVGLVGLVGLAWLAWFVGCPKYLDISKQGGRLNLRMEAPTSKGVVQTLCDFGLFWILWTLLFESFLGVAQGFRVLWVG